MENDFPIYKSRGLKLIALKFLAYDGSDAMDKQCVQCMQKCLYGTNQWFYFNQGFEIKEKDNAIDEIIVKKNAFDSSAYLFSDDKNLLCLNVSAIVGENGTGKSTVFDTIIRLINNVAAAIIGEDFVYTTAEHLHYIDNLYASLVVYIDTSIKVITCRGRKLALYEYKQNPNSSEDKDEELYLLQPEKHIILDGTTNRDDILRPQPRKRGLINELFYTLVFNYSLYAYNYRDYIFEKTDIQRINKLVRKDNIADEEYYWLNGVFHKNDGYQTPVVIHPKRYDGYILANQVNDFGKQNLISLCFEKRDEKEGGEFPFRLINQTHQIVAFSFNDRVARYAYLPRLKEDNNSKEFKKIQGLNGYVKSLWGDIIEVKYELHTNHAIEGAWNYLAYKTFKVLKTYTQYSAKWKEFIEEKDDEKSHELLKELIRELLNDFTHRTVKLRRTVIYIRFYQEEDFYFKSSNVVNLDDIYIWMQGKMGQNIYPNSSQHVISIEDLIPPSFLNIQLQLVDKQNVEAYKQDNRSVPTIPFEGLSSGERQIAYSLSNIVYHLKNIDSTIEDTNTTSSHVSTWKYSYVNLMLDEVELYFHPDLQRRFISLLLDSIKSIHLKHIVGLNITLVTHSPFVLSDIPSENILCLTRRKGVVFADKTFAANIHDLFNNTFILPNTIGEYAQTKLTGIIDAYNEMKKQTEDNQRGKWFDWIRQNRDQLQYLKGIIGDDYLQSEISDMITEMLERVRQ